MSRPGRNATPDEILRRDRTFFTTTKTFMGKNLLQSERNARLLIDVLRSVVKEHAFELHDFVIMPDHLHLLLTVHEEMTIEKAMQLVKGRFSYRLSHEFEHLGEVWQRGFSEVQVLGKQNFEPHRT
jgi:putative transposase